MVLEVKVKISRPHFEQRMKSCFKKAVRVREDLYKFASVKEHASNGPLCQKTKTKQNTASHTETVEVTPKLCKYCIYTTDGPVFL